MSESLLVNNFLSTVTHEHVVQWLRDAKTRTEWDHEAALGDTLKEKSESLYVKLVEVTNVLIRKGTQGYFWVIMSPEPACIFETFYRVCENSDQIEMGSSKIYHLGSCNRRWQVFVDPQLTPDVILLGVGRGERSDQEYGVITLRNFIT